MQKVSANLVNTSGDILNLLLVLEHYKNDGGPSETEFREEYVRDGTFKDVKLQGSLTSQFRKRFVTAVIDNLKARFDTKLLLKCKFLDVRFWPDSESEKIVYGDKEVKDVANFFNRNPMETVMAFRSAKTGATTDEYNEFLEIISIFPVSTAECERGFSALNDICTKERNRICTNSCSATLYINVNGPPLSRIDFAKYVHEWLKKHRSASSQDRRSHWNRDTSYLLLSNIGTHLRAFIDCAF